jgi:hypothetical protein
MTDDAFMKRFKEVFNEYERSDLSTRLNTFIFYLKKGNVDELKGIIDSVNIDLIINKILEIDKKTLKKQGINISELRRRLTEADFEKLRQISGPKGDVLVVKIKELIGW